MIACYSPVGASRSGLSVLSVCLSLSLCLVSVLSGVEGWGGGRGGGVLVLPAKSVEEME